MNQPRIGIVGAGPGGLILARILHLQGISATVFEREQYPTARPQGGSLDMHPESGQYAIERAGLTAEFKRIARYEDQQFRIYDKHGNLKYLNENCSGDRPEVDRGQLRQMLLDSVPEGVIRWGRELRGVKPLEDGSFELAFQSGANECFDLVVGADGAWSRIRPLLSEARPIYSGVTFIELGMSDADRRYPEVAELVGHGLMFAVGDSKAIIGHRDSNAHVGVYAGFKKPEGGQDRIERASLAEVFSGWSENLREVILKCDDQTTLRGIYALPIGHRWKNRPGVTLIGDAAHLMSPFSGEGANLAMLDAAELALALGSKSDWPAVEQFESKMFARAEEAAKGAKQGIDETFSVNGLAHILEHLNAIHAK